MSEQNAETAPPQIDLEEYATDIVALMSHLGINGDHVKPGTATISFTPEGYAVLEYTHIQAIPPRMLGLAMLRGAGMGFVEQSAPEPADHLPKRTAKKTTPRRGAQK